MHGAGPRYYTAEIRFKDDVLLIYEIELNSEFFSYKYLCRRPNFS